MPIEHHPYFMMIVIPPYFSGYPPFQIYGLFFPHILGFADSGSPKNNKYSLNRFHSHGGFSIGKIKHLKDTQVFS